MYLMLCILPCYTCKYLLIFRSEFIRCLCETEKIAEDLLRVDSLEWPVLSSQQILTELYTIYSLKKQLEDKTKKVQL